MKQRFSQDNDPHRWKILGIGVAANASFAAVFQGLPTTAVLLRTHYHLSNYQLGLALGLLGLGIAVSEIPWGLLTDRWGDRRILLAGLGSTAAALCTLAGWGAVRSSDATGFWLLTSGLFLIGLLGGSVNGSSGRAVMSWFTPHEQGFAMSVRQIAYPLGGGIGALLLPFLASQYGFTVVFTVLALGCLSAALFTWVWLHEAPHPPETREKHTPHVVDAMISPLRDAKVWRLITAIGLLSVPQFAIITMASLFLHDVLGLEIAITAAVMILIQAGAIVARLWSGRWTDRHRNRPIYLKRCSLFVTLLFGCLALALFCLTHFDLKHSIASVGISILIIIAGIGASAWTGIANAELATQVGIRRVGTALGMCNTAVYTALFFTPYMVPVIAQRGSWEAAWVVCSLFSLGAYPLFRRVFASAAAGPINQDSARR